MRRLGLAITLVLAACDEPPPPSSQAAAPEQEASGVTWESAHDPALVRAKASQKPVLIDFMADWCVPCKELDVKTYPDPGVRAELARFVTVKINTTEMTSEQEALMARYKVMGLPTLVFIDSRGNVLEEPRVTGFVEPKRFVEILAKVR